MASLIRLKQIESGSSLEQAAEVGSDFSGAVYQIIDGAGIFSSSAQVNLVSASNYDGFVVKLDVTMSSDLERNIVSASISQSVALLSQTYVTTASLNTLSSSLAVTDSQSLYLIGLLSSSVQATSGDFSSSVASQFSSSYVTIYSISSSTETTINNLSSSIATTISASEAGQLALSGAISTTITNLSSSFDTTIDNLSSSIFTSLSASEASQLELSASISTTISASEAGQTALSGAISTTINNLSSSVATSLSASEANIILISSSINTSISSSNANFAAFSNSIDTTIKDKMNAEGVISSSAQLAGATLTGITFVPADADSYSVIISGAAAIVNATGLSGSKDLEMDTTVPGQLWINGQSGSGDSAPPDPFVGGEEQSNIVDMGEW
jgi:hypothetical protein